MAAALAHKASGTRCLQTRGAALRPALATRPVLRNVAVKAAGEVNDDNFGDLVLKSKVPVLVDYWAPWCGPCRMIAPVVDELADEYTGRCAFYKLNTDESPNSATTYGVRSIPTIMMFKGGELTETVIGAVPKKDLAALVEKFL